MKKAKTVKWIIILVLFLLFVIALAVPTVINRSNSTYSSLSDTDKAVLTELDTYFKAEKSDPVWKDFSLYNKTILAIDKSSKKAFLVNPAKEVKSIFAAEVKMPEDFSIRVYRISAGAPQLLQFSISGNFNTIGKTYNVFGNEVYFTKYNKSSFDSKQDSGHYITLLSHEAFHYYMQNNWPQAGRFDTEAITDKDLDLMDEQYMVYAKIYDALKAKETDKAKLSALAKEYVEIANRRHLANPNYMEEESLSETAEGTAMYIGLHSSKKVGYDFKIMNYYDVNKSKEAVELPFDTVVPSIKDGTFPKSLISSEWVYHTGALLCEFMDALGVPD